MKRCLTTGMTALALFTAPIAYSEQIQYTLSGTNDDIPYRFKITYDNESANIFTTTVGDWQQVVTIPDATVELTLNNSSYTATNGAVFYYRHDTSLSKVRIEAIPNMTAGPAGIIEFHLDIHNPEPMEFLEIQPLVANSTTYSVDSAFVNLDVAPLNVRVQNLTLDPTTLLIDKSIGQGSEAVCQNVSKLVQAAQNLANLCY